MDNTVSARIVIVDVRLKTPGLSLPREIHRVGLYHDLTMSSKDCDDIWERATGIIVKDTDDSRDSFDHFDNFGVKEEPLKFIHESVRMKNESCQVKIDLNHVKSEFNVPSTDDKNMDHTRMDEPGLGGHPISRKIEIGDPLHMKPFMIDSGLPKPPPLAVLSLS
ncbi:hypothetical protein QAD02_020513 [Eretmocerus hayati]|uniref:Uncharacterized protein n=1 Tax=Eretmocerus hayati TaxID=131215 RepID=A0ACC2PSG3_9HYME|nr:hypothetical protein QAD02_020513 [Eretmocerus hayati]